MSTTEDIVPVRRALISVSDKTGLAQLGAALKALDVEILSTGGTARSLADNGIEVVEVSAHTGFPEIMDGRVKTLHPKIHGGLLGRRGTDDAVMADNDIAPIELLVVNLYPFEQTVARSDCTFAEAIENIDIGGPAMLRAAAKNHANTAVVIDPADYAVIIEELSRDGGLSRARRRQLAAKVFVNTARYDGAIANYLTGLDDQDNAQPLPEVLSLQVTDRRDMRYGENPHQQAAFYRDPSEPGANVANAEQLQGKALSYNNVADTDAALECVKQFEQPACVIVKHANPCGVALGETALQAYQSAYRTDPTSAFGGIIAFNRELDEACAAAIIERQFVEVIVAPSVSDAARAVLQSKENVRVLVTGSWQGNVISGFDFKRVTGGLLVQDRDHGVVTMDELRVVSRRSPTDTQLRDLMFAWQVAKFVKSNAIVYVRDAMTIGIGAGQMSRVYSARIAGIKAADEGLEVAGSVMASDAFFPFRDGLDAAHEAGIVAVIQPGGSMRDEETIAAADEHDMAMVFTGMRHFRH